MTSQTLLIDCFWIQDRTRSVFGVFMFRLTYTDSVLELFICGHQQAWQLDGMYSAIMILMGFHTVVH